MWTWAQKAGRSAEKRACCYLKKQGLFFLQSNFSCRVGEIDLIMSEQGLLVFVEVRYRKQSAFGDPIETVSFAKKQRLIKTALYYLLKKHLLGKVSFRFDIVGLSPTQGIVWIKNAFDVEYPHYF